MRLNVLQILKSFSILGSFIIIFFIIFIYNTFTINDYNYHPYELQIDDVDDNEHDLLMKNKAVVHNIQNKHFPVGNKVVVKHDIDTNHNEGVNDRQDDGYDGQNDQSGMVMNDYRCPNSPYYQRKDEGKKTRQINTDDTPILARTKGYTTASQGNKMRIAYYFFK